MLATPGAPAFALRAMDRLDATALTLLGLCWHILRNSDARTDRASRRAIKIRAALPCS